MTEKYQELDRSFTRVMITAERKAGSTYSTRYDWSPTLKVAVQGYRFCRLKYRQSIGLTVSHTIMLKTLEESDLPLDKLQITNQDVIIAGLREAYQQMAQYQQRHRELRSTYLETLTEAIVLHQSPTLNQESAQHILEERKQQQIHRMIVREQKCRAYRKIDTTLNQKRQGGLGRIDIPDTTAKGPDLGDPNDPKA